jgi:hypothetical protein
VDQTTLDHLRVSTKNRDLARALLAQSGLDPAPWEWVAVIAFYSAVHYVNAYLWERYHLSPANHQERSYGVLHDQAVNGCKEEYELLKDRGFHARYSERFSLTVQEASALVTGELRAAEAAVLLALGQPLPTW